MNKGNFLITHLIIRIVLLIVLIGSYISYEKQISNLKYENTMYKELIEKLKNVPRGKECDEQFFQLKGYTIYILNEHIKLYKKLHENNN